MSAKRDAILYEEEFGAFTRLNIVQNPANNKDKTKNPNTDLGEEMKKKMPKGPCKYYFVVSEQT